MVINQVWVGRIVTVYVFFDEIISSIVESYGGSERLSKL